MPPSRAAPILVPIHAILLSFPIALFSTAAMADVTYLNTAEIQWTNFAQWAITGALVFGAPVVVLAIVGAIRRRKRASARAAFTYVGLTGGMWVLGLIDAFKHSQDAWSSVEFGGLFLSLSCAILAIAAGWMTFSTFVGGNRA